MMQHDVAQLERLQRPLRARRRVPDHEICIAFPGDYGAFARVQTVELCGVGGCKLDEFLQVETVALGVAEDEGEARLHARYAVGDAGEFAEGEIGREDTLLAGFGVGVEKGTVVRGEDGEGPVAETRPDQRVVGCAVAGWGGADAFGAGEAGGGEVGTREEEVLWAGFGVDGEVAGLGGADVGCGGGGGDVDDEEGGVDEFGEGDGAVGGFGLDELRAGGGVVFGREEAAGFELRGHPGEDVAVLGVDHGCDACLARGEEDVEDLVVWELEGGVGHEDFEGGDAPLAEGGEFGEDLGDGVGNYHVEGVVGVADARGFFVGGVEDVEEGGFVLALGSECDDGGGAASYGTSCACEKKDA